jgi:hypothetical protein
LAVILVGGLFMNSCNRSSRSSVDSHKLPSVVRRVPASTVFSGLERGDALPLAVVWVGDGSSDNAEWKTLVAVLWSDDVLANADATRGEEWTSAALMEGRGGAILQAQLIHEFEVMKSSTWPWIVPHASRMYIAVRLDDDSCLVVCSQHELFEQQGDKVMIAMGVAPLGSSTASEILRSQPPEYIAFRSAWLKCRQLLTTSSGAPSCDVHIKLPLPWRWGPW